MTKRKANPQHGGGPPVKYTAEFIQKELNSMLLALEMNPEIVYKGELFLDKEYSRFRFSEWVRDCKTPKIAHTVKKIEDILETRAVKRGFEGKGNPAFLIFHLKNNFGWKDKKDYGVDDSGGGLAKLLQTLRAPQGLPNATQKKLTGDK